MATHRTERFQSTDDVFRVRYVYISYVYLEHFQNGKNMMANMATQKLSLESTRNGL